MTLSNAAKNLDVLVEQMLCDDEGINVATDSGNVVIISEELYRSLLLTAEVNANPAFKASLIEGLHAHAADFVDESEVKW